MEAGKIDAGTSGAGTGGTTAQRQVISRALVTGDGRHVVVPSAGGRCVRGATLTAAETSSTVALVLRDILSGSSVCPADLSVGTAAVTLRHPLWGRSLTDGPTGRLIPYLDGRKLLRVTYLEPLDRLRVRADYHRERADDRSRDRLGFS